MKGQTDEGVDEPVTLADGRSNRWVGVCYKTEEREGCPSVFIMCKHVRPHWPSLRLPSPLTSFPSFLFPPHSIFVNGLRALFPGIDILSEETEPEPLEMGLSSVQSVKLAEDPWLDLKDVLITVDPLDATKEFTENLLQYVTTMVRASGLGGLHCRVASWMVESLTTDGGHSSLHPSRCAWCTRAGRSRA